MILYKLDGTIHLTRLEIRSKLRMHSYVEGYIYRFLKVESLLQHIKR